MNYMMNNHHIKHGVINHATPSERGQNVPVMLTVSLIIFLINSTLCNF